MIYPAFQNLSVLRLEWNTRGPGGEDALKILKNLPRLASSLNTLSLRGPPQFLEATIILSLDFPHLKSLRLFAFRSLSDTEMVQGFLKRHPHLESLSLEKCWDIWFSDNVEVGCLPSLKHLKVLLTFCIVQKA
jgi:hypothetical protein